MSRPVRTGLITSLLAILVAWGAEGVSPDPAADVARGSEDAFAEGLQPRELRPRSAPLRWTSPEAAFVFRFLPTGPRQLQVRLHGHRRRVLVSANGTLVGALDPGVSTFETDLSSIGSSLKVHLTTEGFLAGGRRLGAELDRVALQLPGRAFPSPLLVACFLVPGLGVAFAGLACGLKEWVFSFASLAILLFEAWALHPSGILHSKEAIGLAGILTGGALLTRLITVKLPDAGRPWAFVALLLAVVVQGAAATSPLLVQSDAVFQANKLQAVAGGDLFPTSETQHNPPFRFPYGVSFFALLAVPFRLGADPVTLVRWGAALSGLVASVGLLRLLSSRGAGWGGLSVVVLQLFPGAFALYSFGNLSNIFAQSMSVLFFVWWVGGGSAALGAFLLLLAGLGHFSSFLFLLALCPALILLGKREGRRLGAVGLGLGLSILYYLHFVPLMWSELSRLRGGGGATLGSGAAASQGLAALFQWGLPCLALAAFGLPRWGEDALERALIAFWAAGGVFAVLNWLTPLNVRYVYALTLPLAIAAGRGAVRLFGQGYTSRIVAVLLIAAQAVLAFREIAFDLVFRYRGPL